MESNIILIALGAAVLGLVLGLAISKVRKKATHHNSLKMQNEKQIQLSQKQNPMESQQKKIRFFKPKSGF
jgi:uncharacterized membrane-anchored protein YhcB (DUF1043 family)